MSFIWEVTSEKWHLGGDLGEVARRGRWGVQTLQCIHIAKLVTAMGNWTLIPLVTS